MEDESISDDLYECEEESAYEEDISYLRDQGYISETYQE